MRIVHIVFSFRRGGLETMLVDIMGVQAEQDEVHLVMLNDLADADLLEAIDPRVHIHNMGRKPGSRNPLPLLSMNLLLRKLKPDVVHLHQGSLRRLLRLKKRPWLTVHALDIPLDAKARSCRMVAISEAVAQDVRNRYPDVKEIAVIPNGINTDAVEVREDAPAHKPVRIVQVARFDIEKKGQDILIEALKILTDRGYDAEVTLIGGADYDRIPEIESLATQAGVADRVHIVRGLTRPELYSTLKDHDLMAHPSRWEGFGLVIAEGMAAGLPLVVPDQGGPYEVADRGRLAETFPLGDARGCADAIGRVIDNYDDALKTAREARSHVVKNYSLRRLTEEYRKDYLKSI